MTTGPDGQTIFLLMLACIFLGAAVMSWLGRGERRD